ncbi:hypothetical protein [Streptomyces sp. NPDC003952]
MRTPRMRRSGAAASAAVAALALAAGLTTPVAAATMTVGSGFKADQPPSAGQGFTELTLITGDQVTVDSEGRPVGFAPAKGREKIPVSVRRDQGGSSLVPLDART